MKLFPPPEFAVVTGPESVPERVAGSFQTARGAGRAGMSLPELLMAIVVAGILMSIGYGGLHNYIFSQRGRRAAHTLAFQVTIARSLAIRSGQTISLVANETARSIVVRDSAGTVYRSLDLGSSGELTVERLDIELAGDSLVFSRRGMCLNCAAGGVTTIIVEGSQRRYTIEVSLLGRVELASTEQI